MKRIFTFLLALVLCGSMIFSLGACDLFTPDENVEDVEKPEEKPEEKPDETPEHTHAWTDADCDTAKTCGTCGETEGEALGHSWTNADCDTAKTCGTCGETEGEALGHTPAEDDYNCETAVECTVCGGEAIAAAEHADENNDGKCDSEGCNFVFFQPIYTTEDLVSAIKNGGVFKLMNDLDVGETDLYIDNAAVTLDLGGFTFTTSYWLGIAVGHNSSLMISNGTVKNVADMSHALTSYGDTYINNCTLEGTGYWSLYVADNTTVVENSVIKYGAFADNGSTDTGTIIATNNVTIVDADLVDLGGLYVDNNGKIILSFDPTSIIGRYYNNGTVTDNGDGTWTVAVPPHTHSFQDATCTLPKTCTECGETEGEELGHDWIDADCETAKTCDTCGETEGEALGHAWIDADCDTAKTCDTCGETEGEALGHSYDYKGQCERCDSNILGVLSFEDSFSYNFDETPRAYFYIDTEIGKGYTIVRSDSFHSCFFDVYNESGEKIVSKTSIYSFKAEESRYYFSVYSTGSGVARPKNTFTLTYQEREYEAEGVVVHEIEPGKTLNTTVKDKSVWVKVDNTTGKYNGFVFLANQLTGSGNRYYYNGIVYEGWSTSSSVSYVSPMEVEDRQVVYYRLNFNVDDGTEVSIDFLKPTVPSLGKETTIKGTDYVTEDGRIVLLVALSGKLTYEVTGDLGAIEIVTSKTGTYIGEANGVHYVQSTTSFDLEIIVKVENPEGSFVVTKHTTHTDSGDGYCACGTEIEAT